MSASKRTSRSASGTPSAARSCQTSSRSAAITALRGRVPLIQADRQRTGRRVRPISLVSSFPSCRTGARDHLRRSSPHSSSASSRFALARARFAGTGARAFLETVAGHDLRLVMVTNSHRETLAIKTEVTGVAEFFDEIYTSHDIGHPKEDQPFWAALQEAEGFDSRRTLFIDDNLAVLRSARTFGIGMLLQILCPERDGPAREAEGFAAIDGVASLLQC